MIYNLRKNLVGKTFIDLFSGLGGFRLAAESLGAKCVFSSDIDKKVSEVYKDNFGDDSLCDITAIDEKNIPSFDILLGGFPCQSFSISGKQLGFEDTRGTLFFDVVRIAKYHNPQYILLENVKNLEAHDNGKTLNVIKSSLEEIGYQVWHKVLDPTDFGVPHKRERIYIVASKNKFNPVFQSLPTKYVKDILEEESEETKKLTIYRDDYQETAIETKIPTTKTYRVGIVGNGGQGERIYSPMGSAITLTATGGGQFSKTGGYLINGKTRRLTIRECLRLQGFPEDYIAEKVDYKMVGNSVVVDILQVLMSNFVFEEYSNWEKFEVEISELIKSL